MSTCSSKRARGASDGVDRLSSLPNELLHRVMSFLPMPEVVRTSLLSPRWRYLWVSTPYIHIDHQDFMDDSKLKNFGNHLLLLRDGATSLDEAQISAHKVVDGTTCCEWIRHAIMHKVLLLHVSAYARLDSTAMFPSQHLKIVRLKSNLLKRGFFRQLNCDCSVLEHLELEGCGLSDVNEISSRSLKVLHIIRCHIVKGLVICASNLTHLSIVEPRCRSGAIVTRDLPSLVTASVSLRFDEFHYKENTMLGHGLLDGLSHATTLQLHAPLPEHSRGLRTCPVFSNLTSLVLGDWCMAADFYPLRHILHRSPKLKELSFNLEMEECRKCKELESALPSSRGAPSSGAGSHPCIERIKIHCQKEDPRVGALVQALLLVSDVEIGIERR
ncbi:putative FBD-associated F-box protein At5g56440 [Triticum urartu]|uniref:putative FBD-associated F-box protein At5g56440 n=1 Tax=Triticum urartu TaxID=4572 RepID=UPI002042FF27|nr:putative FBD-associated F-box protein At5g56440 [Triticum urartu]